MDIGAIRIQVPSIRGERNTRVVPQVRLLIVHNEVPVAIKVRDEANVSAVRDKAMYV